MIYQNLTGGGDECIDNVDFITLPYENRFLLFLCYKFSWWFKYYLYKGWERNIYRYLKKSGMLDKIDLIHYAAPVGYREPGYLWKLKKPYVWGPFGGMYRIPKEFLREYPGKAKILGYIKNALNFMQFHSHRIKKVFNKSGVLIACTKTQRDMVNRLLKKDKCLYLPENGIDYKKLNAITSEFLENKFKTEVVNIIWIGRNDTRKNARLFSSALKKVKAENFHCTFIGADCSKLKSYFAENEALLSRVDFIEQIPREEVLKLYKNAHLMAITSSMEANTTVLFEAMENCVPVITVDHCGMADVVKDELTGIKVKVQDFEKMSDDFARKIDEVCASPEKLLAFAKNIHETSYEYSQEYRMEFFEECYKKAIEDFRK